MSSDEELSETQGEIDPATVARALQRQIGRRAGGVVPGGGRATGPDGIVCRCLRMKSCPRLRARSTPPPSPGPCSVRSDVARVALFLAADAPPALTGSCVDVFG